MQSESLEAWPKGCYLTTIGEITLSYQTEQPKKYPSREFKYIDISSIDNSTQTITVPKIFMGQDAPSRARRVVKKDDVLFSTVRTYLKNIVRVPKELDGVLTSTGIAVLRPSLAVDSNFLFYYVLSEKFIRKISSTMDGTLYPAVTDNDVNNAEILLPPLNEQKRIVAKIEALQDRSRRVKGELDAIAPLLDQFRRSVLAAAFRGDLTKDWRGQDEEINLQHSCPNTWTISKLSNVIENLQQGWSPKCKKNPSTSDEIWGVIKTSSVQSLDFIDNENKELPSHLKPKPELEILAGDILITRAGPRVRAGVTCFVSSTRPKLIVCDKVYRFRPKESMVISKYLAYFLNSPSSILKIDNLKTGISESGVNLTQKKFLELTICFPTIDEQKEIVKRVEGLFKLCDRIEEQYKQAETDLETLNQAILAKAFRGELVPQDPDDEPASVLLERIRQEREAKGKTGKQTKRKSRKTAPKKEIENPTQLKIEGID